MFLRKYSNNIAEFLLDIDDIISRLLDNRNVVDRVIFNPKECQAVAVVIRSEFNLISPCIFLNAPIKVVGDIHGQFVDLLRIFDMCGYPPNDRYLFLGDYVDRGRKGLEVIMLLFLYKLKYPDSIYLLRGNHECERISRVYGFRQEIKERFNSCKIWKAFMKTFQMMPMCAIIEKTIFCCHGGLSPEFLKDKYKTIESVFEDFNLPTEVATNGILCDLVWADPMDIPADNSEPRGWVSSNRGCSWLFGYDVIKKFLNKFDLDMIVRAHQVVEDGYEFYCDRLLVTLFSAPRYCGEYDNAGGIFVVEKEEDANHIVTIDGSFRMLKPDYSIENQWFRNLKLKSRKK